MYHLEKTACKVRIGLRDTVQHGLRNHFLEGRFEVKSSKNPRSCQLPQGIGMVLIIVFAPSGLPTPYCKSPAHLATGSFFAANTDLSANLRRKDIMRSGLWPLVGLASGVICPALRYCRNEVRNCCCCYCVELLCTNKSAVPRQRAKIVPMFRAHAKWSWFTESWHFAKCDGDVLSHF